MSFAIASTTSHFLLEMYILVNVYNSINSASGSHHIPKIL